jgi:hypothetical protein
MGRLIICTLFTKQYWNEVANKTDVARIHNIIAGVRIAYKILVRKRVWKRMVQRLSTNAKLRLKWWDNKNSKWYLMVWNDCPLCCWSHRYPARKILCAWYCTLWWRGLCVFGLWEGIHSADQLEETCETVHWWGTFPLSLWWKFRPETWSEKMYCRTAWSKIVVWNIYVFWHVTCYSITCESSPQQDCLPNSFKSFEIVLFYVLIYFILSVFCVNTCYRSILCSRTVSHFVFFPL